MRRVTLEIPPDHPAFAGHFPSRPIVPGVVLLDASLRAIDALLPFRAPYRVTQAKFVSIVGPGETLALEFDDAVDATVRRLRIVAGSAPNERVAATATLSTGGA
jgi:3-hydroxyacyl-[acyl-carrier-protein] dehydratase